MLQNLISGLQPMVDHALVGRIVGYAGNAAIGVAVQIFIVVIVFVMSVFSGMGVLVSRFAGANQPEQVNRTVYQAFLAAVALWGFLLAPLGWVLAPTLLGVVHAVPAVRDQAAIGYQLLFYPFMVQDHVIDPDYKVGADQLAKCYLHDAAAR